MEGQGSNSVDFSSTARWLAGTISVTALICIFLFQRIDWVAMIPGAELSAVNKFIANRAVRFLLNDIFGVLLILAIFGRRDFVVMAIWVQVAGFVLILLPYIILKYQYPHYNGPLISFLHRIVLNPVLIYLLMFFLWYQEDRKKKGMSK